MLIFFERVGRLAEKYRWMDEKSLASSLAYITGGKTPLDQEGNQVWPKVGDKADFVFLQATCSAEAIARRAKRPAVMRDGKIVAGSLQHVQGVLI